MIPLLPILTRKAVLPLTSFGHFFSTMELQFAHLPMLLIVISISFLLALIHKALVARKYDEEPPYVYPKFPYFGHIIGMLRYKMQYYVNIGY